MVPTRRGTLADQAVVPAAIPDDPVELVHLTEVTATLSLALPAMAMDEAVVELMVNPGESIDSVGATVSVAGGVGVGGQVRIPHIRGVGVAITSM